MIEGKTIAITRSKDDSQEFIDLITKEKGNVLPLPTIELVSKGTGGVLKEIGPDKDGNQIVVKDGRYGVYITNGKVNVTVPKESDYDDLTLEEAIELIKNKKPKKRFFKKKE